MVIIVYDDIFLQHDTGYGHPENANRISNTISYLKNTKLWNKISFKKPTNIPKEMVCKVHDNTYFEEIRSLSKKGGGFIDPDTVVSPKSYEAAIYAAGACITGIDEILAGNSKRAFCLVRPPGHHALPSRGMGFCLFNNVAIAAKYLQSKYNLKKILIIDWDVHHGNGTQNIFYEDPSVLYFSIHKYPYYPGTGNKNEKGNRDGTGYTINLPISGSIEPIEYINLFKDVINGAVKEFAPEFVIISAGFDAYKYDPIGGLGLDCSNFSELTEIVVQLAQECCNGHVLSCLEGGYNLADLPLCIEAHLNALI